MSSTAPLAPGAPRGQGSVEIALSIFTLAVLVVGAWSTFDANAQVSRTTMAVLVAAGWLPLLARHRWPLPVLAVTLVVECCWLALVPLEAPVQFNSAPVAVMLAAWEVGMRCHWKGAAAAAAVAAQTVLVVGEVARGDDVLAANVFALDLVLVAAGAGMAVRSRRRRLVDLERRAVDAERDREAEARRQVAAERFRMARELHDVVAHHLALVNAQAGVAAYLVRTDAASAEQALDGIADHTRQALDELRATVGLLRQYDAEPVAGQVGADAAMAPMPGLETLTTLLDGHRAAGVDLTYEVVGTPRLLPAVNDLAAYRILQESLTNARKHAPGAAVRVQLDWGTLLGLTVTNDAPPGGRPGPGPGTGHGLLGMHERAAAIGGGLEAGTLSGGGYRVRATIPVPPDSPLRSPADDPAGDPAGDPADPEEAERR